MKYTRKILPSGLTVICLSGLSANAVTIGAFIRGGVRFDPKNKPGLSHFVEHMVFNGTTSYPKSKDVANAVEKYGGWHMAYTWIEHQKHTMHLPKDGFEEGMKVFLETLFSPLFNNTEIEKEKGIVKEEVLTNKSDPAKAIWDYVWFPLFFANTPLARPYSGTEKDIDTFSQNDLFRFTTSYFQPNNMVLFVAGDLEQEYIYKVINKLIKNNVGKANSLERYSLKSKNDERVLAYKDESYYQTSLMVGFPTVPFDSKEKYIFEILKDMLAGSFGTPLIQKLRDENGLIYTWNAFQDNLSDAGYIALTMSANHENIAKVSKIILQEMKRFSEGNFTEEEFILAKNHLVGSLLANTQTGLDYIELYGLQELLTPNNVFSLEDIIGIYKEITYKKIKEIAKKFIIKENIFIGTIGSFNKEDLIAIKNDVLKIS